MGGGRRRRAGRGGGALDAPDRAPNDRDGRDAPGSTSRRWVWFGALWLAGVATVSLVAWILRTVIAP